MLAATGFRRGLEPLVAHLDVLDGRGLPRSGSGVPTPGAPGLWFIGYHTAIEGNLRQHPIEARRVARAIARARQNAGRRSSAGSSPCPEDIRCLRLEAADLGSEVDGDVVVTDALQNQPGLAEAVDAQDAAGVVAAPAGSARR